jgi:hypothetical protein
VPRYIIDTESRSPRHDRFMRRLVEELTSPGTGLQPMILEERVRGTGSRHIHVIWDDWKGLSDEQRAEIVIDAYTQAEGEEAVSDITIAEGLTTEEALVLGLLPYVVEPLAKEAMTRTDHRRVFAEEAGRTLLGGNASQLRYPRREDANAAVKRLKKALPRSSWEVIHEVQREM